MANTLITPDVIAGTTLYQLENNCVAAAHVYRGHVKEFAKIGSSVRIKRPNKFLSVNAIARSNQDVTEGYTTLTVDQQEHVSWEFTQIEKTLTVKDFNNQYAKPAGIALANALDEYLCTLYKYFWLSGGTPGTTPNSFAAFGDQATLMDEMAVPDDGKRTVLMSPRARWVMADALKGSFDPEMAKMTVRKGWLPPIANMNLYGDQNVIKHTCGTRTDTAGDCLVNGANQHSNASPQALSQSLIIDDSSVAAATIKAGDVFTIDNVYSVNPVSKLSTGRLQQFTVRSDVTLSSGAGTLTISPAIVTTGAYQNVNAAPADNAGLNFLGAASGVYAQNLAFHEHAIALAVIPIELPDDVPFKARATKDGLSLAVVKDFDIDNYKSIIRIDLLFGAKEQYPETGSRLWGSSLG